MTQEELLERERRAEEEKKTAGEKEEPSRKSTGKCRSFLQTSTSSSEVDGIDRTPNGLHQWRGLLAVRWLHASTSGVEERRTGHTTPRVKPSPEEPQAGPSGAQKKALSS